MSKMRELLIKDMPETDELIAIDGHYFGHMHSAVDSLFRDIDGEVNWCLDTFLSGNSDLQAIHDDAFVKRGWNYDMRSVACYFMKDIHAISDSEGKDNGNVAFSNLVKGISVAGKDRFNQYMASQGY